MSLPPKPHWAYYNDVAYIRIDFTGSPNDNHAIEGVSNAVTLGLERSEKSIRALIIAGRIRMRPESMRQIKN